MEDLLGAALDMALEAGEVPSRNRLMAELRIGAAKASQVRDALTATGTDWAVAGRLLADAPDERAAAVRGRLLDELTAAPSPPEPEPVRHLHAVPDTETEAVAYPGTGPDHDPQPGLPEPAVPEPVPGGDALVTVAAYPGTPPARPVRRVRSWPLLLLALPAFVAIWSGWVGLGELAGFGIVHPLPGIADKVAINTAITLPIGMEIYAAYALRVWLSGSVPQRARRFARWSAIGSLLLGAAGQVAYHLMAASGVTAAPWPITTAVACLPVAVLGMGAALAHLIKHDDDTKDVI
ncbi:hypothetical protein [Longispora albida]|uniref:hypothetical protein n=1 Tax=Longispora albida TaxID=203523 RepID=UPI00037EE497